MCNVHRHNYWLIKYNTKHSRYTDTISTHLQRYASMRHQLTCLGFLYGIWHSLSSHDAVNFEGVYYYIIMNQIAFLLHQFYSILFYILIIGRRVALKSSPWVLPELLNPGFFLLLYELNRPAPLVLACWPPRGLNCPPALPCSVFTPQNPFLDFKYFLDLQKWDLTYTGGRHWSRLSHRLSHICLQL